MAAEKITSLPWGKGLDDGQTENVNYREASLLKKIKVNFNCTN